MTRIRTLAVVAAAVALALVTDGRSLADAHRPVVRASGASPFAACAAPSRGEAVTVNAEDSPIVAANPARRGNLIATWNQDSWSIAGAHGSVAAFSFDGGRSWARTTLPFSTCAPGGGPFGRSGTSYVSVGPDGTAYALGESFAGVGLFPRSVESVVSTDGGRSWHSRRVLANYPAGGIRLAVTPDPARPGRAYAVWQVRQTDADGSTHVRAFLATTGDGARSWSSPVVIAGNGAAGAFNNHILIDARTGRLYDTYTSCAATCTIAYITSSDRGRSWSPERRISDQFVAPVTQPGTGIVVNTLTPALSAISASGEIVLAWEDSRFSGNRYNEIAVSRSRDGGRHWTTPHRASTPTGHPAFLPAVAISADDTIAVTYYDVRRDNPADAPFSTDVWATTSHDGVHFDTSRHLAGSFDVLGAPSSAISPLGTNQGLTAAGNRFVAVFEQTTCRAAPCPSGNPTDIYGAVMPARD